LKIGDDDMQVSKEEILHIANLARLELEEDEIDKYILNLQDILNFANVVNNAPVEGLDITIGANEAKNVFRKDEIEVFEDTESLLQNAVSQEQNMFKIPKVL
jgi:aspartyl-tRNA(Asn)/glutamyl-tRNA(Gln) amidotransferase subunit C